MSKKIRVSITIDTGNMPHLAYLLDLDGRGQRTYEVTRLVDLGAKYDQTSFSINGANVREMANQSHRVNAQPMLNATTADPVAPIAQPVAVLPPETAPTAPLAETITPETQNQPVAATEPVQPEPVVTTTPVPTEPIAAVAPAQPEPVAEPVPVPAPAIQVTPVEPEINTNAQQTAQPKYPPVYNPTPPPINRGNSGENPRNVVDPNKSTDKIEPADAETKRAGQIMAGNFLA